MTRIFAIPLLSILLACETKEQKQSTDSKEEMSVDSSTILIANDKAFENLDSILRTKKDSILFLSFWIGMNKETYDKAIEKEVESKRIKDITMSGDTAYSFVFTFINDGTLAKADDQIEYSPHLSPYFVNDHLQTIELYNFLAPGFYDFRDSDNVSGRSREEGIKRRKEGTAKYHFITRQLIALYTEKYGLAETKRSPKDKNRQLTWTRPNTLVRLIYIEQEGHSWIESISYSTRRFDAVMKKNEHRRNDSKNDSIKQKINSLKSLI